MWISFFIKGSILDYKNRSIIISAIIIALGILFSNGIYKYDTPRMGVVQRYNIFTGTIELCVKGRECKLFFDIEAKVIKEEQAELAKLYKEAEANEIQNSYSYKIR